MACRYQKARVFVPYQPKTSEAPVVLCRISFPQHPNTPEIQPTWTRSSLDLVDLQRAATASRHRHREGLCDQDLALSENGVEKEDVLFLEGVVYQISI